MVCNSYKDIGMKSVDEVFMEANSDFNNSGCSVHFFLPREAKNMDLRLIRCYPNLASTIIYSNRLPKENRTEWCEDGPLMPYFEGSWFRNFYCSSNIIPQTKCNEAGFYREYFTNKWTGFSIAILISYDAASIDRPTVANENYQEACLSLNNTTTKVGKLASTVLFYSNFT